MADTERAVRMGLGAPHAKSSVRLELSGGRLQEHPPPAPGPVTAGGTDRAEGGSQIKAGGTQRRAVGSRVDLGSVVGINQGKGSKRKTEIMMMMIIFMC